MLEVGAGVAPAVKSVVDAGVVLELDGSISAREDDIAHTPQVARPPRAAESR